MENEHDLSGLMKKRSKIAGKIEHMQRVPNQLVADLAMPCDVPQREKYKGLELVR